MIIPKGVAFLELRDYEADGWVEDEVLCEIEVTMVCFSKQSCRLRFTPLEDKFGYKKGVIYKNKDLTLTDNILGVIFEGLKNNQGRKI